MAHRDKSKVGKLLQKGVKAVKKRVKKETSKKALKQKAVDFVSGDVKDRVKDASRAKDTAPRSPRIGGSRSLAPVVEAKGKIEIKHNRKKRKQKKKIAEWERQRKAQASAGVGTKAFLELDKKYKSGKQ